MTPRTWADAAVDATILFMVVYGLGAGATVAAAWIVRVWP